MKLLITSLLAFFCCTASYSQTKASEFTHLDIIDKQVIPEDTAIRKGVLDNGLTYYVRKSDANAKYVNFNLLAKGGSVIEEDNELGIAHFVEHLIFKGTKHFPGHGVQDFFRRNGIPFGHDSNATTGFTYVRYVLNSIASNNELLMDSCLLLMRDFAGDATISDADVESERNVIVEEWRERKKNYDENKYSNCLLNNSIYAKRRPIGNMDIIQNCSPKLLRDFYRKWYQPQNLAIVVVGDICPDKMIEKIRSMFGDMKRGNNVSPVAPKIADATSPYYIIEKTKDASCFNIGTYVRLPMVSSEEAQTIGRHRRLIQQDKIRDILLSKFQSIKDGQDKIWSHFVIKAEEEKNTQLCLLRSGLVSSASNWKNALELYCKQIELIRRHGFKDEVLRSHWESPVYNADSTAIEFSIDSAFLSVNSEDRKCKPVLDDIIKNYLYNAPIASDKTRQMFSNHILNSITEEQLHQEYKNLFSGKNMTVRLTFPESTKVLPTEDEVKAVINQVRNMSDEELADVEKPVAKELLQLNASKVDINPVSGFVKKIKVRNDSVSDVYLSNGVKVVLWKRKNENDNTHIYFYRPSGFSVLKDDEILYASANPKFIDDDIRYYGMIHDCVRKYFNEHFKFDYSNGPFADVYHDIIPCTSIPDVYFKTMYATLTSTEVDTVAFRKEIKKFQMNAMPTGNQNHQNGMKITNALYVDSKRLMPPSLEDVEKYDDIERFGKLVKEYKSNYNGSLLVISGEFDTDSIMPYIKKYVASLPSKSEPVKRMVWDADHFNTTNSTVVEKIEYTVPICYTFINYTWEKGYKYSKEVHAHNQVLNSVLAKLVFDRLRTEHGDVYSPSCYVIDDFLPVHRMRCNITFTCNPQKREQIVNDVKTIVNEMAYGNLITQPIINSYVKEREQKASFHKDNENNVIYDFAKKELGEFVEKNSDTSYIKMVTPASLKAHLKRMLKKGNLHIGYLTTE